MNVIIEAGWKQLLQPFFDSELFLSLTDRVRADYASDTFKVYPPPSLIFNAFNLSPLMNTKVVIVGQDPYHGPGQANGLAFSVNPGIPLPPSLRNILLEVHNDTGAPLTDNGDLSRWASQGVLLLNSSLTVKEHSPKSHSKIGWEDFTDFVISRLAQTRSNIVFILWGADAIRKGRVIDPSRHLILSSPHPSPLSAHRGFFGNNHFSRTNEYLIQHGLSPIKW